MLVTILFDGEIHIAYAQAYVQDGFNWPSDEMQYCFAGQQNGLCGAGVPGGLWLVTGLHTGRVAFTVKVHDVGPEPDSSWEEIVEVSFRVDHAHVLLVEWAASEVYPLPLDRGDYRVRYSAQHMDAAHDHPPEGGEPLDRYLLQFWRSPPTPDAVLKQTSSAAAYWHDHARRLPIPPSPAERAAAKRLERERVAEQQRVRAAQAELAALERAWDGRLPSERVLALGFRARNVADLDRALLDALDAADPTTQRQVCSWVIERALSEAALTDRPWLAPALRALRAAEPLPPPFDASPGDPWALLWADPDAPSTLVRSLDGRFDNCHQQSMALPALFAAGEPDPLAAVLEAVMHAATTFGGGRVHLLFAELRRAFPTLARPHEDGS